MSSAVKYSLFILIVLSLVGGELILNGENAFTGETLAVDGMMTGNLVKESGNTNAYLAVALVVFILVTLILLFHGKKMKHPKDPASVASLLMRIALGIWLINFGYHVEPTSWGYFLGTLSILFALAILIGIKSRIVSYLAFFFILIIVGPMVDFFTTLLLIALTFALFLMGPGKLRFK